MLVIRGIHVKVTLKAANEHHETANRLHGIFADKCPVYRTLNPAIAMTSELAFEAPAV